MKICIVCSGNFDNSLGLVINKPAIYEQIAVLKQNKITVDLFLIDDKGVLGYLRKAFELRRFLNNEDFDLIHAHSGLSGLLVAISTSRNFVITFHGSDINNSFERILSSIASLRSLLNIYVSEKLLSKAIFKRKATVIPCGINFNLFSPMPKSKAREKLKLDIDKNIILFSSRFDNVVKNYKLAFNSIKKAKSCVTLIELKNKTRKDVMLLLNASDLLLLTSFSEGSPQIIKEALACNRPIIALDVGDVKERLNGVDNCYIAPPNPDIIAKKIDEILINGVKQSTEGRKKIQNLTTEKQTLLLIEKYKSLKG